MVAITIVTGAIGVLQTYVTNRVGQRVMEELRNRLYEHLQGMSLRFFTGTRTGEIQSRLTNDVGGIQSVVTDTATSLLSNIVTLLSTLIAMLFLSWQLTVALAGRSRPLFVFYTYRAGKVRRQITMQAQESKAEISAITEETLSVSGMLLAKVFGRGSEEVVRFRKENHRLANLAIRQEMIGRALFAVIGAFFSSAPALVYLIAGFVIAGSHGPRRADPVRNDRRVHDPAEPPLLPHRQHAVGVHRDPGEPGALRAHLRLPQDAPRHRRLRPTPAWCRPATSRATSSSRTSTSATTAAASAR